MGAGMSWQAEMLGIDLANLASERFSHPEHYAMLKEHGKRVKEFELTRDFDRYMELKRVAVAQAKVEREAVAEAVRRNRNKRKKPRYQFTDAQLAIAMRSLG